METSKVINSAKQNQAQSINERVLPTDELKKLTDFFSILIEIDRKSKRRGNENGRKDQ